MKLPNQKSKKVNVELGTAYDINKNLVLKYEKELSDNELLIKTQELEKYISEKSNHYYMLLCHEKRDYSIFHTNVLEDIHSIPYELIDVLKTRGQIYGIDKTQDNIAIECWIVNNNEASCYYFFPYDAAIIEC